MLGDGGYKLQRVEDLKIFFVLSITHLRAVQHGLRLLDILDLGVRKCVTNNIL
jgi:hypothetical protein